MTQKARTLIAGNWKMNGLMASLGEVGAVKAFVQSEASRDVDVALCLPATLISAAAHVMLGSALRAGGQDCHAEASGPYTGDVSAPMLADAGVHYVIIGHSERRAGHHETDADVRAKAQAALDAGLVPIICVGETRPEREAGRAVQVVAGQLAGSVPDTGQKAVIAYEPVWAIGTGLTPTLDDIAEMHDDIRARLRARFGEGGETMPILYGGSMKPGNAAEILTVGNVNGGLIGGASLKAADFIEIIRCAGRSH